MHPPGGQAGKAAGTENVAALSNGVLMNVSATGARGAGMSSSLGRHAEDDQVFWCDEADVRLQHTEDHDPMRSQPGLLCTRSRRRSPYCTVHEFGRRKAGKGAEHSRCVGFVPRVEVRRGDAAAVGKVSVRADVVALAVALGGDELADAADSGWAHKIAERIWGERPECRADLVPDANQR
jgi:hypothetical protein